MSIRKLFDGQTPYKVFSETKENIRKDVESLANVSETIKQKNEFIPIVDFSDPANFARYGSAESYYNDAITRIYENYPYDGSSKERQEFLNESTYLDLWLLENKYPRTNGHITISAEGWGSLSTAPDAATAYYGNPTTKEYINFFGGPNESPERQSNDRTIPTFDTSNKYDTDIYSDQGFTGTGTRESNLKTNFDNGVTVEFWLKKDSFNASNTEKEVIFDLWNGLDAADSSYGRVLLQLEDGINDNFTLSIQSGSSSPYDETHFGTTLTPTDLQTFSHYAFRMYNEDSLLKVDFYKDGSLLESKTSSIINEITGALQANLGALTSPARVGASSYADVGWGKLSGSLDEFRFWKTKRSSEDIGRYWFTQIYGGTNTDISNTDLGVYFKFNEGITGDETLDSTVLDYSGRITNGSWTGYNSSSRSTQSAMVLAGAASSEFKDPIIYTEHPEVESLISEMQLSGSNYDFQNYTSLYNSYPTWIIEEDETTGGDLKRLSQVMSSFLDTLYLQIDQINKIKNVDYLETEYKNAPFNNKLLTGVGFVAPEIFGNASLLNQIFDRSENKNFEESLFEIKNTIYKNIYNNINSIYKSKGTNRAFRNLIRCYGVDEDLININAYASNITYDLKEDKTYSSAKKNFIDFYRNDGFYGTIYQQTSSANPLSTSYISASQGTDEDSTSFTLEAEFILPTKRRRSDYDYYSTPFLTSSLFEFHSADPTTPTDFTWPASDYDIQAYTVMPQTNGNDSDAYFLITSSYYGFELTSPLIRDMYKNKKWNISLSVSPAREGADLVSGSTGDHVINFYAVNAYSDVIQQEVSLQTEIAVDGEKLLNNPKRIYAGAHRQNFTGSTVHGSDVRLSAVRYWTSELSQEVIKSHAENTDNYGSRNPLRNVSNFVTSIGNVEIPQIETLALHWRFDQITETDNGSGVPTTPDAGFNIVDFSSGSLSKQQNYGWMGQVIGTPHTGRGDFFYPNDTKIVNVEFVPTAKQINPEVVSADNTVKVFNIEDDQVFTKRTRPSTFMFMAEKSMYAAVTSEILNYFASILDFNHLIGDPVNKYRQEYKSLGKLRELFFAKVQNEPDVERYIEYYKWIDDSLGQMLMELFPASADKQDGIRNVIESHILERNKYWNKYPAVDLKQQDPEAGIRGIHELTYDWERGHHPVSGNENESCFWWKERAERDQAPLATGDSGLDADKQQILSTTLSVLNRKYSTPVRYSVKRQSIISSGLDKVNNIRENVKKSVKFGESDGIIVKESDIKDSKDCIDDSGLNLKRKIAFKAENQLDSDDYMTGKGNYLMPFTAFSSSVQSGYQDLVNTSLKEGFGITNLHIDSYIDNDVPLQGIFTNKFVGGNQHRHVKVNEGSDNQTNRPESWSMEFQASPNAIKFIHQPVTSPRATLYRDMVAKRSLNIKNIKTNTATHGIGNYSDEYEIVQTVGRTTNNSAFVKAGGFSPDVIPSTYVAGMDDYTKPDRGRSSHVFVNRFSSPGDPNTMGDSDGGPGLDVEAAEYSPYNAINYRNWSVREPLVWLYASHINQFGFYSDTFGKGNGPSSVTSADYSGTASVYQVNRNPIRQMKDSGSTTVTASVYDNYYVQHPIPRTDIQYTWITASALSYDTFGYLPYDGEGDLVTFSSASDFVSIYPFSPSTDKYFGDDKENPSGPSVAPIFLPTVYNGLNYNVREPLEYLNSFIGYSKADSDIRSYLNDGPGGLLVGTVLTGEPGLLNGTMLKRNGPYQHPSWKQTRGNENPLVRKWNYSNLTAYNKSDNTFRIRRDPPVISKYKPLHYNLQIATPTPKGGPDGLSIPSFENLEIASTFGNDITLFANRQVSNDLNIDNQNDSYKQNQSAYAKITQLYSDGALDNEFNPVQGFNYFSYAEQIYPAAINMYSKRNRERVGYKNTFWKDSRVARSELGEEKFGGTNSQGYNVSQSAWALDAAEEFGTGLSTHIALSASLGKAGELQNDYTIAFDLVGGAPGTPTAGNLKPGPIYSRKHTMGSLFSAVSPTGPESLRTEVNTSNFAMADELNAASWPGTTTFNDLGHVSIFGGNAKFEAHEQAGFVKDDAFVSSSSKPFYDKYDLYVQNMRLKNKDMSLVPEFRISDHVTKYIDSTNGFLTPNTASFSIFGINENNTETVSYVLNSGAPANYEIQTSENTPQNSGDNEFYRIYSFSDFMENFEFVDNDHNKFETNKDITLTCKALKKFIAYDGFYPAERTLDIASKFSEGYKDYITGSTYSKAIPGTTIDTSSYDMDTIKVRPVMQPLFSPGILFNTIKSGIAVDYPLCTEEYETVRYFDNSGNSSATTPPGGLNDYSDYYAIGSFDTSDGKIPSRLPFEALLSPGKHLESLELYDCEPHPSASLSIRSGLEGTADDKDYTLMIDNFLGEIPKFFLQNSELTSLKSADQSSDFIFEQNKFYGMRVKMRKSLNKSPQNLATPIPLPQIYISASGSNATDIDPNEQGIYETMTMYSRPSAFGPPLASGISFDGSYVVGTPSPISLTSDSLNGYYLAYTPPYYDGEAWADIVFTPTESRKYELAEIIAQSSVKYWRVDKPVGTVFNNLWPSAESPTPSDYPMNVENVNDNAMQLNSSINLFNLEFVEGNKATEKTPRWVIQTKFETPMFNFADQTKDPRNFSNITTPDTSSSPWLGYGGKTTTPLGMWHQFGLIPEKDQGIFLEVSEISPKWLQNRAGQADTTTFYNGGDVEDLSAAVGFGTQSEKLGSLNESKTVFEAVVAVPFVEVNEISKTKNMIIKPNQTNRNFFELPIVEDYSQIIAEIVATEDSSRISELFPETSDKSIIQMSKNIKDKYVFPPQFDFFRNAKSKPVAMYIFEFEHTFDRDDLSYIWQNIAPKVGNQFEEAEATITHPLLTKDNLMEDLKDKVKWMVFKVKQRAETRYLSNVVGSKPTRTPLYSYNWPYDYFSLIEFAKIDSTVSYGELINEASTYSTKSSTGLTTPFGPDISTTNSTPSADAQKEIRNAETIVKAERDINKKDIKR